MLFSPDRRRFLQFTALTGAGLAGACLWAPVYAAEAGGSYSFSDAEWKARLTAAQYDVLRQAGTEAAFTSPLLDEYHKGLFACAGCALPLFSSGMKFDSGTGWPSFFDVLPGAIQKKKDTSLFMERTEYHCSRCGGHQGHLFEDGPAPTGLRYCNNGVALAFQQAS